ncbi:MAG: hypothetical protein CVU13_00240 [Bacteroidetes bacterium HGW-Bacteroidetes-8]|jgi:hypothetical protein|nr:MAG: hypothetical protein CVU13_00240 [Bacteroidetes bacterium HGW-Bacteroidetes-8]
MINKTKPSGILRYTLGALLAFGALNAFGGGYYGIKGAEGVPLEWLEGSPFKDYFIPGLTLFLVVGGSFLTASIACFINHKLSRTLSFASVAIVFGWLVVQVIIIGYVSWMQPVTAVAGVIMFLLALALPAKGKG